MDTQKIITVLEQQHRAIDLLLGRLIAADSTFRPTQSGSIWEAVVDGHALIENLKSDHFLDPLPKNVQDTLRNGSWETGGRKRETF